MTGMEQVTLKEAQFLLNRSEEDINRAIDRGEVERLTEIVMEPAKPSKKKKRPHVRHGRRTRQQRVFGREAPRMKRRTIRKLGQPELVYFALERQLHEDLTPAGRRKLYAAIKGLAPEAEKVSLGPMNLQVKPALKHLAQRYRQLRALRSALVEGASGDPTFKGTGISVYVIASLAGGQSVSEILEDYPGLKEKQVELAVAYASAYPKKGRPYPRQSFKRMAAALASSGALDADTSG